MNHILERSLTENSFRKTFIFSCEFERSIDLVANYRQREMSKFLTKTWLERDTESFDSRFMLDFSRETSLLEKLRKKEKERKIWNTSFNFHSVLQYIKASNKCALKISSNWEKLSKHLPDSNCTLCNIVRILSSSTFDKLIFSNYWQLLLNRTSAGRVCTIIRVQLLCLL